MLETRISKAKNHRCYISLCSRFFQLDTISTKIIDCSTERGVNIKNIELKYHSTNLYSDFYLIPVSLIICSEFDNRYDIKLRKQTSGLAKCLASSIRTTQKNLEKSLRECAFILYFSLRKHKTFSVVNCFLSHDMLLIRTSSDEPERRKSSYIPQIPED